MVLSRTRRGVFFTLASMFFIGALVLIFSSNTVPEPYDTKITQVYVLDDFRDKIENLYVPLLTRHATYQALYYDSEEALNRGFYLALPTDWNETVWTGNLRGVAVPAYTSLPQHFNNLETMSQQLGYNLSIALLDLKLSQSGPYQASYFVNFTFNLTSIDGNTHYQRNVTKVGSLSLIGVPDLYYNRHAAAAGISSKKFFRPHPALGGWNNQAVINMAQNGSYRTANTSADIFGRLQGSVAPSIWGIETLMPPGVGVPVANMTTVDHEFFQNIEYTCTYEHAAIYPSLRLSIQSVFDYNITGATISYNGGGCPAAP